MKYPFVQLRWMDAISVSEWVSLDDLPVPVEVLSRGWLVKDEPDYVTLVSSMQADSNILGEVVTIPKGMIVELKHLEER